MTHEEARAAAEKKIQNILIDLENDLGETIDCVNVDTREFANCAVEIFFDSEVTTFAASPQEQK